MDPINLINVCKFFKGLPHQIKALEWLQRQTDPGILAKFAEMWRADPLFVDPGLAVRLINSVPSDRRIGASTAIPLLLAECQKEGVTDPNHIAYIMGTVSHESAFSPVKEVRAGSNQPELLALQNRYWHTGFYGRGYVQITWMENYQKFARILGLDLVGDPDLALEPNTAAAITVIGMARGLFTGKKLADYDQENGQYDFVQARRIVNGVDRAVVIAEYARYYLSVIKN